ncbi:hypothetical protein [Clostridium saccharoperbutylacetonicum]|uniref:hypothetical protein n=1 Tax=Clostridium saccharoperbutylacetonicum TaxID=36745 RepID=UPI000983E5F7|nr:hypothetical protein [Clostridium saccharoperbutylacetonicum]AQR96999.1 hypothetical protein CLSAP_43230 [Clostridium saccharoperbutylacetonicum]NSB32878.1 lactate dehydrogenase-like 2-hydroxyacid dehydrogenase [Clostridium saccharoperbutylacetonicum]
MQENYLKLIEQLEKQKYKFKSYYNSCITLLEFESRSDNNKFEKLEGKKIFIYGCGDIGKRFYHIVKNSMNVIGFIDKSARDNQYKYDDKIVVSIDKLNYIEEYDYVVVTLNDIYQIIYDDLLKNGVRDEKIKSLEEIL